MHFRKTWEPFKSLVQKCRRISPGSKAPGLCWGWVSTVHPPRDSQCNFPTTTYYPLGISVYIISIGTDASKANARLRITSLQENSIGHAWLAFHPLFCHSSIPQLFLTKRWSGSQKSPEPDLSAHCILVLVRS